MLLTRSTAAGPTEGGSKRRGRRPAPDRRDADDGRHQVDVGQLDGGQIEGNGDYNRWGRRGEPATDGWRRVGSRGKRGDGRGAGDGAATDGAPAAGSGRRASELGGRAGRAAAALWCGLGIGFQTGGVCTADIYLMAMTPHVS